LAREICDRYRGHNARRSEERRVSADKKAIPRGRLRRLGKIVGMTTRVGADMLAGGARRLLGEEGDPRLAAARKILETLGELKGAAMKAGQMMALFSDQLPPEARQVVARLFSQAPTLPFEQIAKVVESELGRPPLEIFAEFSQAPFAGASLGQVHVARLKTGEEVAVKVQYPEVGSALQEDLKNAEMVVRALGIGGRLLDRREYFDELRQEVSAELDYRRELKNLEDFRGYLSRWPDLVVPRAYPELCASKVLVLERLAGPTLHEFVRNVDGIAPSERFEVGERLSRAILGPFIYHHAIHGDAHPGNFVVMEGHRLGVLDYGSAKHLSERFWAAYLEGFTAALEGRRVDLPRMLRGGGFVIDLAEARAREVMDTVGEIVGGPLWGPYDFGADTMVRQLMGLKRKYALDFLRVRIPPEGLLFYRAIAGLGHDLRSLKAAGDFRPWLVKAVGEVATPPRPAEPP
jgi:predicted unusual protein kinase regulating ubiquinone biosynthesis (AarF/ABC1/UbiB family)